MPIGSSEEDEWEAREAEALAQREARRVLIGMQTLATRIKNLESFLDALATKLAADRGKKLGRATALQVLLATVLTPELLAMARNVWARLSAGRGRAPTDEALLKWVREVQKSARALKATGEAHATSTEEPNNMRLTEVLVDIAWRCVLGHARPDAATPERAKHGLRTLPRWLTPDGAALAANYARAAHGDVDPAVRASIIGAKLKGRKNTSEELIVLRVYTALAAKSRHVALSGESQRAGLRGPLAELIRSHGAKVRAAANSDTGRDGAVSVRSVDALHGRHQVSPDKGRLPARKSPIQGR